jgi:hypothetical protein
MALDVVQDYTKEVRRILQDAVAPYRYTDDNLVSALNMGLLEARRLRPDFFANNTYIQTGATIVRLCATGSQMCRGSLLLISLSRQPASSCGRPVSR